MKALKEANPEIVPMLLPSFSLLDEELPELELELEFDEPEEEERALGV